MRERKKKKTKHSGGRRAERQEPEGVLLSFQDRYFSGREEQKIYSCHGREEERCGGKHTVCLCGQLRKVQLKIIRRLARKTRNHDEKQH